VNVLDNIFTKTLEFYKEHGYTYNEERCKFMETTDKTAMNKKYYLRDARPGFYLDFIKTLLVEQKIPFT